MNDAEITKRICGCRDAHEGASVTLLPCTKHAEQYIAKLHQRLATLATEIEDLTMVHDCECHWQCDDAKCRQRVMEMRCPGNECTCGATAHNERVDRLVKLARGER